MYGGDRILRQKERIQCQHKPKPLHSALHFFSPLLSSTVLLLLPPVSESLFLLEFATAPQSQQIAPANFFFHMPNMKMSSSVPSLPWVTLQESSNFLKVYHPLTKLLYICDTAFYSRITRLLNYHLIPFQKTYHRLGNQLQCDKGKTEPQSS